MKKTILYSLNLLIGMLFIFLPSQMKAQSKTEITITGIRSVKGKIILQIFKDNVSYDDQQPYKKIIFDKKGIINGNLTVNYLLEHGIYGITMVDDENENGKMDQNFIKMPKEGFGFSNFFMEKLKKPSFDDFKVDVKANPKIVIKVKYM